MSDERTVDAITAEIIETESDIALLELQLDQLRSELETLKAKPRGERPFVFREEIYVPLDRPVSP